MARRAEALKSEVAQSMDKSIPIPGGGVLRYQTDESQRLVEGMTRDEVCRRFQSKVMFIARRLHERLSSELQIPLDDLAAVGAIGLLEAFDRFEPARGIQFTTFAEYRVRGAMYDALRDNDSFSRRRRQLSKRVLLAAEELRRANGQTPTATQVAERLGISLDEYHAAVDRTKPVVHVPLDAPDDGQDSSRALSERLADPSLSALGGIVATEVREALKTSILELPERQRQCVMMYYGNELTLAEIAQVFGITVSRVSQILTEAREKLRKRMLTMVDSDEIQQSLSRSVR
jgi:RNA polymerase sigma factor for flagellar operon FliA